MEEFTRGCPLNNGTDVDEKDDITAVFILSHQLATEKWTSLCDFFHFHTVKLTIDPGCYYNNEEVL